MCLNINLLDVKLTYLRNIGKKKKIFGEYEYKHVITQKRKKKGLKTGKKFSGNTRKNNKQSSIY